MRVQQLSLSAPRAAATTLSVSTSTGQFASAFQAGDYYFMCDQNCYILFGSNPSATTSCVPVPAWTPFRIAGVQEGEKLAVIAAASGTAYMARAI